jgi:hypothetical protein
MTPVSMNSRGILPILEMAPQTMAQDTFWKGSRPNFLFAILWNHKSETLAAELFPHQKNNIVTCKSIEELLTFLNSSNIIMSPSSLCFLYASSFNSFKLDSLLTDQLQWSGILIGYGSIPHTLNTGSHLTAVDNLSIGLNTQSCKQPNKYLLSPT